MCEITNYKLEFVERTKTILEKNFEFFKEENLEVTFLLNCLLGLIVTVSENQSVSNKIFDGKMDDDLLNILPDDVGFTMKLEMCNLIGKESMEVKIGNKRDLRDLNKTYFINKLRNAIAHQNIFIINEYEKVAKIKFWNKNNNGNIDFEIIFTVDELKKLALKIASDYIKGQKL